MARILLINVVLGKGSTGKIVADYADHFQSEGHEVYVAFGRGESDKAYEAISIKIGSPIDLLSHGLKARLNDEAGWGSRKVTSKFLAWADSYDPDVLWLHNLHGYYLNLPLLFEWIRSRPQMKVILTLHDCWLFTGHCSHFTAAKCKQWETGCKKCPISYPYRKDYPKTFFKPKCARNFARKEELFAALPNLQIVTPSAWLAEEARKSFLSSYPITTIPNRINSTIFHKRESALRASLGLGNSTVVISVANRWTRGKGFYDIVEIIKNVNGGFCFVLIGLNDKNIQELTKSLSSMGYDVKRHNGYTEIYSEHEIKTEPKKTNHYVSKVIPEHVNAMTAALLGDCQNGDTGKGASRVLCFERTDNQESLAEFYSSADVFINCTHEDNYPTVNIEAQACGCPVISYDVGGCKETTSPQPSEKDFWMMIDGLVNDNPEETKAN